MKIFLIRHGLTNWNHEHRFQGHTDIELSSAGIKQAYALKKRFSAENLVAIYSSDLQRALKTAEIINEAHQLSLQISPAFREFNFGVWEGLTYEEIVRQYPQLMKIWRKHPCLLEIPQGESLPLVRERAVAAFKAIIEKSGKHADGSVAVVCHGMTIAALLCGLLEIPLDKILDYKNNNAAVTLLTFDRQQKKISLALWNDFSHLDD